jgi:hypothetical protein
MNKSKFESKHTLPWGELLEICNNSFGVNYKSQPAILRHMYNKFDKNINEISNFLGVSPSVVRNKLINEGVHKAKKYKKREVGPVRKMIRESAIDAFINMDLEDIKEAFPNYNTSYVCKVMRQEGREWRKRWYWCKYDKDKYYRKYRKRSTS